MSPLPARAMFVATTSMTTFAGLVRRMHDGRVAKSVPVRLTVVSSRRSAAKGAEPSGYAQVVQLRSDAARAVAAARNKAVTGLLRR